MKLKNFLFILICVLFLPIMANAKEYCKVISGNGKDIGSEIACGTEHFYVVNSNQDEVKMLAKYNLYTGITIHKEKISLEDGDTRSESEYCDDLAAQKGGYQKRDGFYNAPGYCFYVTATEREDKKVLQSEDAKSAHWDEKLNYLYPQVGDVYMPSGINYNMIHSDPVQEGTTFFDYDFDISGYDENGGLFGQTFNPMYPAGFGPLYFYKKELSNMGYTINNITLLSLSELDNISKNLSNKSLPLKTWGENVEVSNPSTSGQYATEAHFGSLKEYIPDAYKWLYSTTYWNRTVFSSTTTYGGFYHVFVAEQGKLCGAGFEFCAPTTTLGCGLRPTITIPANELQYLIKTETSDGGSISVVDNSLGGETITFDVSTNKGFKLKGLILRTDSGEEVEFNEEDLTYNDDGTVTISKNKFIMPFENVTIEAKWELESLLVNPKTGRTLLFIGILLITLLGLGKVFYKNKV